MQRATGPFLLEGNQYFPSASVHFECLHPQADGRFWKGVAHYFTVRVGGEENVDAAWVYPDPKPAAKEITGYIAFWRGVQLEE